MHKTSPYIPIRNFWLYFIPLIVGLLFSLSVKAQNFNYSFAKDSVAWQELNTQTILNRNNGAWNFSYKIPIGFSFDFLGKRFDSLTIETNGYLVFDEDRNYAMTAFLGFGDCMNSESNHAVLSYALSGIPGNQVLKIQFKNMCTSMNAPKYFTYQVWLKENAVVEIHAGPNDFQPGMIINTMLDEAQLPQRDTIFMNNDSEQAYRVGFLNMNMDTEISGFFIGGSPIAPQAQPVTNEQPEPVYLVCAPSPGTRYTFTPNFN
ncbi:hypothetical protein BH11BAC7_BH11BAC7_32920 [soil metagenome]